MDAAMITASINAATSAFNKLLDTYVEGQRIDAELEEVRARAQVEMRGLDVQEKGLELQHKENMKRIDKQAEVILKLIEKDQKVIEASIGLQNSYSSDLRRLNERILDINISEETRNNLMRHYDNISQRIENIVTRQIENTNGIINNPALLNFGNNRISSKKQKQLSFNEEE